MITQELNELNFTLEGDNAKIKTRSMPKSRCQNQATWDKICFCERFDRYCQKLDFVGES